jgi:hypothetical protein
MQERAEFARPENSAQPSTSAVVEPSGGQDPDREVSLRDGALTAAPAYTLRS